VGDPHGGAFGDELAFLAGSTCPTATTQIATSITASGATLNGNLLTMGSATAVNACFQWGSASGVYNNQTPVYSVASPHPFTATLTGLTDGVTYYYRAKADAGIYGSAFGIEKSFTAGRTCPTVFTDSPSAIAASSAQLNGILLSGGSGPFPMNVTFQWGTSAGVYAYETAQQPVNAAGTFNAGINGLTAGNLYYYRTKVDDGTSGGAFGSERSFRAGATCPTAATQTATAINGTGATINGNLLTLGSAASVDAFFQWGTVSTVYTNETIAQTMTAGAPFAANLTGLNSGVTYYYRAKVDGGVNGSVFGSEKSFTTGRTNPSVMTDGATTIMSNGGTLNGRLTSLGTASSACVSFQWGTASGVYPNETVAENKTGIIIFNSVLNSLSDNTTYYYRAKVDDGVSGGAFGNERSFRTGSVCPSATTQTATGITPTSAILQGNLLAKGSASVVDACFQWGTASSAYTSQTPLQAMTSPAPFFASLDGLTDGVTYYYRVVIDGGSNGIVYGNEKSFTAGKNNPVVITDVTTGISGNVATLNGVFNSMGSATGVSLSFQWGTATGVYPNETTPVSAGSVRNFSSTITGLSDNTTYYYRAKADNGVSGGAFGAERAFRAASSSPDLNTEPATGVTVSTAVLNANLISLRDVPSCNITFQWGNAAGACIEETAAIVRTSPGIVSCNITGLNPNTVYYFRAKADGATYGSTLGAEKQFTTSVSPPVVATGSAFVAAGSARLNGNLTSLGGAANCAVSFEWGTSPGIYLYETPPQNLSGPGLFSATVSNLSPNLTYYYRAKADAGRYGGAFGEAKSLRTSGGGSAVDSATNRGAVTFTSDAGNMVELVALKASDSGCTLNANEFRYGIFSFKIVNLSPGSSATVSIELPGTVPVSTKYFKCINGMKVNVTSIMGHNDGDKILTLRLTDGGPGDADGVANGIIVDPGGPMTGEELIGAGSHSAMMPANSPGYIPDKAPAALSNVRVSSAALSSSSIVKGESIEVTAQVTNNGNSDGNKLVKVYLNGVEAGSQLVYMKRGTHTDVTFNVEAEAPGHYVVLVDNVAAGEIEVKLVKDSDVILIFSWACVIAAFILGLILVGRRLLGHGC
jgi:phosphodiesterase/alkaline phosphatase D-like protein